MIQVAGIKTERTLRGKPRYDGITLTVPKYTAKLQEATKEADNGQYVTRSLDEVLNL